MKKQIKNKKIGKKLVFPICIDPYRQEVIVVVNGQFSDAYDFIKKNCKTPNGLEIIKHIDEGKKNGMYNDEFKIGSANGTLYTELPHGYVMMLSHTDSWTEVVNTVVHESAHLTHYILRRARLPLCEESEEAYTYLQGHIVEKILEKIY